VKLIVTQLITIIKSFIKSKGLLDFGFALKPIYSNSQYHNLFLEVPSDTVTLLTSKSSN